MKIIYGIVLPLISLATGLFAIADNTVSQIYSAVTTEVVLIRSSDIIEIPNHAVDEYGDYITALNNYVPPVTTTLAAQPVYKHGDCSWLPAMALKAGWPVEHIGQLKEAALRESGCCPNRRGGDQVDKDCNITGVAERTHRSDSGLLQINGVNYDPTRNKWAPICLEMDICTQKPLMDPLTNLKAGKLLFDYWEKAAGNGWIPWDICNRTTTCK
jgi:hypothetical protein